MFSFPFFLVPFIFSFELFLYETQRKTYQNYRAWIVPCKGIFACATVETKLWLSPSAKLKKKTVLARPPPVYQDLSTCHDILACHKRPLWICQPDWKEIQNANPVIRWVLGAQNKDIGAALQTLLTRVKLRLRRRLGNPGQSWYWVPVFVSGTSILGPVA